MITKLSQSEFPRTWRVLNDAVKNGVAPGFVAGLWDERRSGIFQVAAFGNRRLALSGSSSLSALPMLPDTVFDIASVSKVFATMGLAATLIERGWISWETRLSAVFPDCRWPEIELQHLLSHTAGFPWWEPFWERLRDRFAPLPLWEVPVIDRQKLMRELVFSTEPTARPGERTEYSDLSFLLVGFLLEEVTGLPLDEAVKRYVWEPWGIQGAYYVRTTKSPSQVDPLVAATELSPWHQTILQGQVHDENCWAMGGYAGHAGVFARAEDVLIYARGLLERRLSDSVLQRMWTRMSRPSGCERTPGWDTPSGESSSAGRYFSRLSVGHLGFTGTSLWIDPEARLAVTLLSNRIHPTRENIGIRKLRPAFHDAIRLDLLGK